MEEVEFGERPFRFQETKGAEEWEGGQEVGEEEGAEEEEKFRK